MYLYTIKKSVRAKRLRISIKIDGSVVVILPMRMSEVKAKQFVEEKREWIEKVVAKMQRINEERPHIILSSGSKRELEVYKDKALTLVKERLEFFNTMYGFNWNTVSIKNTKSRWGSCSKRRNLSFNYKIALLPAHLADYIVVHELCHLGEMNHSKKFWNLVVKTIPNYKILRRELKHL